MNKTQKFCIIFLIIQIYVVISDIIRKEWSWTLLMSQNIILTIWLYNREERNSHNLKEWEKIEQKKED